jgi:hypothetical protein
MPISIPLLQISYTRRQILAMAILFVAYLAAAQLGRYLFTMPAVIQPFAKPHFSRTRLQWLEASAAFVLAAVSTYIVFWTDASHASNGIVLVVWLISFIWFSPRLGNRFTFLAFALTGVTALTGYGQDEDKKKAVAARFDYHLTKPVGIADLQAVLMPQAA